MSKKRICHGLLVLVMLFLVGWTVTAQEATKGAAQDATRESQKTASVWMKQKLSNSERILEGLTRGDLDLVNKHANSMKLLNKIEYFVRRDPPAYRTQLQQFQFSLDELVRTSADDNLDGATLAFTQMTISCVNCHRVLRKS
jgi:DNA-binding response OmpR family regulator